MKPLQIGPKLLAAFAIVGGLLSRWHGGGFISGSSKLLKTLLYSIPVSAVIALHYEGWKWEVGVFLVLVAWIGVFKATGKGGFQDLAQSPKEPELGTRTEEKLEILIRNFKDDLPRFWYDALGLYMNGLFASLLPIIAITYLNPLLGAIALFLTPFSIAIGYMIGWGVYPKHNLPHRSWMPKDFAESTALGEFFGAFLYTLILVTITIWLP